jgi:hypothetical protein
MWTRRRVYFILIPHNVIIANITTMPINHNAYPLSLPEQQAEEAGTR